jgi:uncharacterized iron-regulated membrane protein
MVTFITDSLVDINLEDIKVPELAILDQDTKNFFSKLRAFHHWLTFYGKFSKRVNDSINITFLVLILSGIYLWLPKRFNSRALKQRLILSKNYPSKSARNYQWHNVFSVYMAPVLFFWLLQRYSFRLNGPVIPLKT